MARARAVVTVVVTVVLMLGYTAFAQPDDAFTPGSIRAEIDAAVRSGDDAKALAVLDRLLADDAPRVRPRHVEAAKAAMELLPPEVGAARASRLLAEALRIDSSQAGGAWAAAQELRKDLIRRVAVEDGVRFLTHLSQIYPNVQQYRHDMAVLLLDGGRRDEARAQLEVNFRMAPSDTWAAYQLALLAEEDGDLADAVSIYDRLVQGQPNVMGPRLIKVRLLAKSDRAAARAALDEAVRAAEAAPSESVRADFLEQCAAERVALDAADARRDAVVAIGRRIDWFTAAALAGWAIALLAILRWTRPASPRN